VEPVLERFVRYARLDTTADESSATAPSTAKQLVLCDLLADECRALGLENVSRSPQGVVLATIPGNIPEDVPVIAWLAHVDTSPEFSGTNVQPVLHRNYQGGDLVLPGDPSRVIRAEENPALAKLIGATIVTSDGTTLLGADDKAGIAAMMTAAATLMSRPDLPHGPVRLCFTCDEEIGRGVAHLDLDALGAVCAYTLDSDGAGHIDVETFSADQAVVTVTGINIHPSIGLGKMVNALRILSEFLASLPTDRLSPETTSGREGFLHPYHIEGGVAQATSRILLRDFSTPKLQEYADLLEKLAAELRTKYPRAQIEVKIRKQYRNMGEGLEREPRAVPLALEAYRALGIEPQLGIIRGGTDGSQLTERGLPTPNLSTGEHNPHSPLEWTCLEEMQTAADHLVELARAWGRERLVT